MGSLVSYMFTSLDGFIADPEGGLGWVPIDDELMRFANGYFGAAGGIVFGRRVYEGFVQYWDHLDPTTGTELEVEFAGIFRDLTRIVVSRTLEAIDDERTILVREDPIRAIEDLKRTRDGDLLLICGPELRATLTAAALVDRHRVLVAPVVLGAGQRLFGDLERPVSLRLTGTRTFGGGVEMLDYEPV